MEREISLTGGGPWGFTLSGGKDFGAPLKVSKITVGGKAAKGGIRFGDCILEINGDTTEALFHSDAMMLIKTTGVTLNLRVAKEMPRSSADSGPVVAANQGTVCPPPVPPSPVTSSPVQKTTVVVPKKAPPAPALPLQSAIVSGIAENDGTQQSPAFKRITGHNKPIVYTKPPPPPTQQMRNIVIDDGGVRKTSQKPLPHSSTATKTTTAVIKKDLPFAKPLPPVVSPSEGTTQVGSQQQVPAARMPPGQLRTPPLDLATSSNLEFQKAAGESKVTGRQGTCESCHQPIRGPYASAMGKVWHTDHFVCSDCQKTLQNMSFMFEEEKIFCEECYQKNFAQTCHGCKGAIAGAIISALGLHWHQEHFTCSRCNTDLSKGSGFNMESNELFCIDCFGALYGSTCFGCNQRIAGGELWVEALDHTWHPACFICDSCHCSLEGTTFFARQGHPCCKNCV